MKFFVAAALSTTLLGGCIIGAGYSTRDRATQAAREYNDDVRWGRYEQAGQHVAKEKRQSFVERHKALDEELEIADYEILHLEIDKSDRKLTKVTASVDYTWSLKRRGLVEKTSTKQFWEENDGDWVMVREERVKGAPLTLFDEPKHE
jgi:hypothetical protein